jgi:hypothetical protein
MSRIAFFLALGCMVAACGGEGSRSGNTIAASQIILENGTVARAGRDGIIRVQANELPANVQVLAANVSIDPGGSRLRSSNLQKALNDEISPSLELVLPGTWTITNYAVNSNMANSAIAKPVETGSISIGADLRIVQASNLSAAAIINYSTPDTNVYFSGGQIAKIAEGLLVIAVTRTSDANSNVPDGTEACLAQVVSASADRVVLTPVNGGSISCYGNASGASVLTRVGAASHTSLKRPGESPGQILRASFWRQGSLPAVTE